MNPSNLPVSLYTTVRYFSLVTGVLSYSLTAINSPKSPAMIESGFSIVSRIQEILECFFLTTEVTEEARSHTEIKIKKSKSFFTWLLQFDCTILPQRTAEFSAKGRRENGFKNISSMVSGLKFKIKVSSVLNSVYSVV